MELFYAYPENIHSDQIVLDDFERRHVLKTMRKEKGDVISVTDGKGWLFRTTITETKPQLTLRIDQKEYRERRFPPPALAFSFIRPQRMEFILEKGTELGVSHFLLFEGEHSNFKTRNTKRFEKILRQAMKQSLRFYLPAIIVCDSLQDILSRSEDYDVCFAALDQRYPPILEATAKSGVDASAQVLLLIGPEGGFSENEVKAIHDHETWQGVSLGLKRLRSETAAVSAIAAIQMYIHQKQEEVYFGAG